MAGRRPKQIPAAAGRSLATLAQHLRRCKTGKGMSYEELAENTRPYRSASTLSRAASGTRLPRWSVVEGFIQACDASESDRDRANKLWHAARLEVHRLPTHPRIRTVSTRESLLQAMRALRAEAGQPTLRELARRAGTDRAGRALLPRSTLSRVLAGGTFPRMEFLEAFVKACRLSTANVKDWLEAYTRITQAEEPPLLPHWHDAVEQQAQELHRKAWNDYMHRSMFGRPPPDSFYQRDPDDEDDRYFLRSQLTRPSSDYDEDDPTADPDDECD